MLDFIPTCRLFVENVMRLKAGQKLLAISDSYAGSIEFSRAMMEFALSKNIDAVMGVMKPLQQFGDEPPRAIADAMQQMDAILDVEEKFDLAHTTARQNASKAGAEYYIAYSGISGDYLKKPVSVKDLEIMQDLTIRLAERFTRANTARVSTALGTDIQVSLEGRTGLALHPLQAGALALLPDYGEATISPVEGTSEGVIVVDASVTGWGYIMREPLRLEVNKGKVVAVSGNPEDAARFEALIATDENADNCAAELAIGTSHTISSDFSATVFDNGKLGRVHIAVGRNNTIGGRTFSKIHNDVLITRPTVELDGERVLDSGDVII